MNKTIDQQEKLDQNAVLITELLSYRTFVSRQIYTDTGLSGRRSENTHPQFFALNFVCACVLNSPIYNSAILVLVPMMPVICVR